MDSYLVGYNFGAAVKITVPMNLSRFALAVFNENTRSDLVPLGEVDETTH